MMDLLIFAAACALMALLVLCLVLGGGVLLYALGLCASLMGHVLRAVGLTVLALLRLVLKGLIALQTHER